MATWRLATTPEILGGTLVFVGTRVPVKILFDIAIDNRIEALRPLIPQVLETIRPGQLLFIGT